MTEHEGAEHEDAVTDEAPEYQRWTPTGVITEMRRKRRPNEDSTAKADKPETIHQARTWDGNKNRYLRYGLCIKCASQAAWGHQIGWGRLEHYPCSKCAPIVQGFPQQSAHPGWRKVVHHSSSPTWEGNEPCAVHGIRRCTICIPPLEAEAEADENAELAVALEEGTTPEWTI